MEWQRVCSVATVPAFRSGWRGAYDALKAAVRGYPRLQVPIELTVSAWVKSSAPVDHFSISSMNVREANDICEKV